MQFALTEDQQFFQRTTRTFLEREAPIESTRKLADDPDGFDVSMWRRAADLGWTSLLAPRRLGGGSISGNAVADLALVSEEIGRAVAPGPFLPVNVVIGALSRSGSREQQDRFIPALMTGESTAAWAFAEDDERWDADALHTVAEPDGPGFALSGTKRFVEAGASADVLLVVARTASGPTQFLVPAGAPGMRVTRRRSLDFVRRFAEVELDGVPVDPACVVGQPGRAADDVASQLQLALALQAAETVGMMDRAFEATLEYLEVRWSFGRPLASYQALKHRIADLLLALETAKGCAEAAATAVGEGSPHADQVVSVAKAYVGRVSVELLSDAVQLHGGIGVTWEHDLHVYGRRVAVNRAVFGAPEHHYERLCRLAQDAS